MEGLQDIQIELAFADPIRGAQESPNMWLFEVSEDAETPFAS